MVVKSRYDAETIFKNRHDKKLLHKLYWAHIVVLANGVIIDSEGIYKKVTDFRITNSKKAWALSIDENTLNEWLELKCWNPMFNTELIPDIKKDLEKYLVESE